MIDNRVVWTRVLLWLRGQRLDPAVATAARQALESARPDLEITDVWLRAREQQRDVVAVLYRERSEPPWVMRGMPHHKLYAVGRDLSVQELASHPGAPYGLRGIK